MGCTASKPVPNGLGDISKAKKETQLAQKKVPNDVTPKRISRSMAGGPSSSPYNAKSDVIPTKRSHSSDIKEEIASGCSEEETKEIEYLQPPIVEEVPIEVIEEVVDAPEAEAPNEEEPKALEPQQDLVKGSNGVRKVIPFFWPISIQFQRIPQSYDGMVCTSESLCMSVSISVDKTQKFVKTENDMYVSGSMEESTKTPIPTIVLDEDQKSKEYSAYEVMEVAPRCLTTQSLSICAKTATEFEVCGDAYRNNSVICSEIVQPPPPPPSSSSSYTSMFSLSTGETSASIQCAEVDKPAQLVLEVIPEEPE
jgi:hypothetical protein